MLILTEKSSVAEDFATALNCSKQYGYFSNGKINIVYCVGHLFKLHDPDFYDDRFKSWKEIPCIPEEFFYTINEPVKKQADIVLKFLKQHKNDEILIATDADREGEIIARECLKLAGITNFSKIKRFWVSQALTQDVILDGIKDAKPLINFNNIAKSGFARQHADWLVGMNFTRYVSVAANKKLSIGRVKTALLSAIDIRSSQINNFKSEKYFEFYATFGAKRFAPECKGIYFDFENNTKFKDNDFLEKLKSNIGLKATVKENKTEKKETPPPQLYNLNALQKDAFKFFGYSADTTLKTIQKLYEEYKCVSYPRTPSKVMGSDNVELIKKIFNDLSKTFPEFNELLNISNISITNKRCFNDTKLEAHHAIIPLSILPQTANEQEKNIYDLIINRFKIAFASPYIYNKKTVILSINNNNYKISGTQPLDYGWKKFISSETFLSDEEEEDNNQSLENIDWNNLICIDIEAKEKYTKPPKYFNEASILSFMENPTNSDEKTTKLIGLGTAATRHTFIPELLANGYIKVDKKNIEITELGKIVINTIRNSPIKTLANIDETTRWEKQLEESPDKFESEIKDYINSAVQTKFAIELPSELINSEEPHCPICQNPLRYGTTKTGLKNWYCTGYFSNGCQFKIWEIFNGVELSKKDIILLCSKKKTSLKTFTSKKKDFEYKAKLYLDSNNEIKFHFEKK